MAVIEDYSPIYVGDTSKPFAPAILHKDGSAESLSGATLSMKMVSEVGIVKVCTGTWTIDDATNGLAHYHYQASDVDTPGIWQLYVVITKSGEPQHVDPKPLEILVAP